MKRSVLFTLLVLFLSPFAQAVELDDRTVLLVMDKKNSGSSSKALRAKLLSTREDIGFSKTDLPIVFMNFDGSETEKEYARRLGIKSEDAPVICVVHWARDATHGPKQIVENAIARKATTFQVEPMIISYMRAIHHAEDTLVHSDSTPDYELETGLLEIENHRFEASGEPNYITDAAVRVRNADKHPIRGIVVRFYKKLNETDDWQLLEEQEVEKLPKGYVAARDFVGNTRDLNLLDAEGNAVECYYRIEVEQGGRVQSREGKFVPSESPVDVH